MAERHAYLGIMPHWLAIAFGIFLALVSAALGQTSRQVFGTPVVIPPPPPPPQPIPVPGAPPRINSFGDRAARCVHHGAASGVRPGQIGQYTRECAQGN